MTGDPNDTKAARLDHVLARLCDHLLRQGWSRKVEMSSPRNGALQLTVGLILGSSFAVSLAAADEYVGGTRLDQVNARCAQYGQGFVDLGNGMCGRVSRHMRVYVGGTRIESPSEQRLDGWAANGTSSAALRTEGMLPGADATHLRVRGGLDTVTPFR